MISSRPLSFLTMRVLVAQARDALSDGAGDAIVSCLILRRILSQFRRNFLGELHVTVEFFRELFKSFNGHDAA
jgi:hypothetical protein